jgi:hypothetical protein
LAHHLTAHAAARNSRLRGIAKPGG